MADAKKRWRRAVCTVTGLVDMSRKGHLVGGDLEEAKIGV